MTDTTTEAVTALLAERDALLAERAKDHAEINLKADFIDATINQLAEAEAERDAAIKAALDMAAKECDCMAENSSHPMNFADSAAASIREITVADVLAKMGAK